MLTLPPWLAFTLVSHVVSSMGAFSMIITGVRRTRSKNFSTSGSAVRELATTGEACHAIYARAFVQTWAGGTFIDVYLAEVTCRREQIKMKLQLPNVLLARLQQFLFPFSENQTTCSAIFLHSMLPSYLENPDDICR